MEDDIDIENHELIDDPQVRRVFPHIDDIKLEILDYGVDVPADPGHDHDDVVIEQVTGTLMPKPDGGVIVKDEPSKLGDHVINLDDSDDDIDLKPILPPANAEDDHNEDLVISTNKIILGSKKSSNVIPNCRDCNIFFDSKAKLDTHNKLKHSKTSNKVILGKKRSFKSIVNDMNYDSTDDFENNIIVGLYDSQEDTEYHSCFHCDEKFNSKQDVVDHLYGVIKKGNDKNINKKNATQTHDIRRLKPNEKRNIEQKTNKREPKTKKSKPVDYDLKKCYVVINDRINTKKNVLKDYNIKQCSVVLKQLNLNTIGNYSKRNDKNDEEIEVLMSNDSNNDDISITSDDGFQFGNDSSDYDDVGEGNNDNDDEENDDYADEDEKKSVNNESKSQLSRNKSADKYKTYYKCILCTCYFNKKNKAGFDRHMRLNHFIKTPKISMKRVFNPFCSFCDVKLTNIAEYNQHIKKYRSTHINKTYDLNNFEYFIYRCLICNDEFSSKRILYRHKVRKHDNCQRGFITEFVRNKEYFDKIQTKDNPEMFSSITAYGVLNPPIPKDVLFRCALCSSHFLNARAAKVHYTKCSKGQSSKKYRCKKCHLDMNRMIKNLHIRQHDFTDKFKVYDVDENRENFLDRLLCLCPKCGVYYGEVRFRKHFPVCGENPPESKYCVKCDILVDGAKNQKKPHELKHETVKEFAIIEFIEVEQNVNVKHEEAKERVIQKNYLLLYYCKNCRCFVRNAGGRQILAHSENRCKKLPKKMCQECGLVMTQRAYATHNLQHTWTDLKLLDYTFYDFFTNKCIDPPFPQFPYCKQCDTHFEDINVILQHKCDEIAKKNCESCDKQFTPHAHKLHMFYHDYRNKKKNRLKIYAKNIYLKKVTNSDKELDVTKSDSINSKKSVTNKRMETENDILNHVLYKCINCELVVDKTEVLLHKKDIDCTKLANKYKTCPECQIKILENDLNYHIEKHNADPSFVKNNIKFIYFNKVDDDDIHTSGVSADEIDTSDNENKYKLYHCVSCKNCFSDKNEVNQHACTSNSKQCMYCRLLFPLQTIKKHIKDHERYKDMTKNNIKLIIFDVNKEDKFDSNLTIMMRNYYVSDDDDNDVMDTKDDNDDVLDTKDDDERVNKTVENDMNINDNDCDTQDAIIESNIIKEVDAKKNNKTSQRNIKTELFKYKLLQCKNCHLNFVEKKMADAHKCSLKVSWNECGYCNNLFNDSEYEVHMQYHNFDKDMTKNIIIKYFNCQNTVLNKELQKDTTSNSYTPNQNKIDDVVIIESNQNVSIVINDEDLDTKKCEKNTINKVNIADHNEKESNQEKNNDLQVDNEKVLSETNISTDNTNKNANKAKITAKEAIRINDKESKPERTIVNIYKCQCELYFLNLDVACKHTFECKTARVSKQNCSKCQLIFTPADLFTHIIEHHGNKANLFDIKIINLTDVKVTDSIFKCHLCELLFTTKTHLFRHYKTCQNGGIRKVNCDKCGFDFYYSCYAVHRKKHHSNDVDMSADQLNVEVINKVDIPKSYFYVKPNH